MKSFAARLRMKENHAYSRKSCSTTKVIYHDNKYANQSLTASSFNQSNWFTVYFAVFDVNREYYSFYSEIEEHTHVYGF